MLAAVAKQRKVVVESAADKEAKSRWGGGGGGGGEGEGKGKVTKVKAIRVISRAIW